MVITKFDGLTQSDLFAVINVLSEYLRGNVPRKFEDSGVFLYLDEDSDTVLLSNSKGQLLGLTPGIRKLEFYGMLENSGLFGTYLDLFEAFHDGKIADTSDLKKLYDICTDADDYELAEYIENYLHGYDDNPYDD